MSDVSKKKYWIATNCIPVKTKNGEKKNLYMGEIVPDYISDDMINGRTGWLKRGLITDKEPTVQIIGVKTESEKDVEIEKLKKEIAEKSDENILISEEIEKLKKEISELKKVKK